VQRDHYATLVMDRYAMRLMGSASLAKAARGEKITRPVGAQVAGLGGDATCLRGALNAEGPKGLRLHAVTARLRR